MNELQNKLTGVLIGLARAAEGNEYLLTDSTENVLLEGLFAISPNANVDGESLTELIERVEEEKKKLVPNCYHCASPCGKSSDYDLQNLAELEDNIRSAKQQILSGLQSMINYAYHAAELGYRDQTITHFFYKALYSIGADWEEEDLKSVIDEAGEVRSKCIALLDKANAEFYSTNQ